MLYGASFGTEDDDEEDEEEEDSTVARGTEALWAAGWSAAGVIPGGAARAPDSVPVNIAPSKPGGAASAAASTPAAVGSVTEAWTLQLPRCFS
mmetsp:Transcript_89439/g.198801  ORF Transcript_89439/g.198801 Transcript_89439/m.198801 type:complete len:93 (+) Transcript_89439:2-280(+)